jgi:hypothetical protein
VIKIFHLQPGTNATYKLVGSITATKENFFKKSQNFDDNKEYLALDVRSTSVDDIVLIDDVFYIIKGLSLDVVDFIFSVENSSLI